jgi:hypothetical protein
MSEKEILKIISSYDNKLFNAIIEEMIDQIATKYGLEAVETQAFSLLSEKVIINQSATDFLKLLKIKGVLI